MIFATFGVFLLTIASLVDGQEATSSNNNGNNELERNRLSSVDQWSCEQLEFCNDVAGFEAIRWLHLQLDDDQNGKVDMAESADFFRHDLQHKDANERQKQFHGNDKHISVDELWKHWLVSEVHNWTVDQTIDWLQNCVQLDEYVDLFRKLQVNGSTLPRLASTQSNYIGQILGIKDPIHRQKLALKAMDVVLFGSPNGTSNYVKDLALATSLLVAMLGCCFAVYQRKHNQAHLKKMLQDMEALQKAEEQLQRLQKELHAAQAEAKEGRPVTRNNEDQNQQSIDANSIGSTMGLNLVQQMQQELQESKAHIVRLEAAISKQQWAPPAQLQQWLQLTHELELNGHNSKRLAADLQLLAAKEACEKLKRKRSTLLGSFRVAHGSSIDDVDNRILQAKESLAEVTRELQERLTRWRQIERLCGFPIQQNRGQLYLQRQLNQTLGNPVGNNVPHLPRTPSDATITDSDALDYPTVQHLLKHSLNLLLNPGLQQALYDPALSPLSQNGSAHLISGSHMLLAQAIAQKTAMLNGVKNESYPTGDEESSGSESSEKRMQLLARQRQNIPKLANTQQAESVGSVEDTCSLDSQFMEHNDLANKSICSQSTTDFSDRPDKKRKAYRLFSALRKRSTKTQLD